MIRSGERKRIRCARKHTLGGFGIVRGGDGVRRHGGLEIGLSAPGNGCGLAEFAYRSRRPGGNRYRTAGSQGRGEQLRKRSRTTG